MQNGGDSIKKDSHSPVMAERNNVVLPLIQNERVQTENIKMKNKSEKRGYNNETFGN